MPFTVVWLPSAQAELANIWTASLNRQAVADAANRIDRVLRLNPETVAARRQLTGCTPIRRWLSPMKCSPMTVWSEWYELPGDSPSAMQTMPSYIRTLADLVKRLGGVPLDRIWFRPAPGTATLQDVIDTCEHKDALCELVAGVLVEKAAGFTESSLAGYLGGLLNALVIPRNLGIVTGAAGAVELKPGLVRIPDVAFTSWDRLPGGRCPETSIPRLAPNLVVDVLRRQ